MISPATDAERAVIARANERALPQHLRMGLTLAAMRKLVKALLLTDVVTQCNEAIPKDADGAPMYPTNDVFNGYVNQFAIKRSHPSESVCERLLRQGSSQVGLAEAFVSFALGCKMETLPAPRPPYAETSAQAGSPPRLHRAPDGT